MKKLILFLIRKRLHLKKYELFTFDGQKSKTQYYFTGKELVKVYVNSGKNDRSNVSLNWILDDDCKIKRCQ